MEIYFGSFANSIAHLLSSKVVVYELQNSHFIPNKLDTSNMIFSMESNHLYFDSYCYIQLQLSIKLLCLHFNYPNNW